jgi:hypothetical protein
MYLSSNRSFIGINLAQTRIYLVFYGQLIMAEIFALLYTNETNSEGELVNDSSESIDKMVNDVGKATSTDDLDWSYSMGRCVLKTSHTDKIPAIIQEFLNRGRRLYMNDGTQVTFPAYSTYNEVEKQKLLLKKLKDYLANVSKGNIKSFLVEIPIDIESFLADDYWIIDEGKEFARMLKTK